MLFIENIWSQISIGWIVGLCFNSCSSDKKAMSEKWQGLE